MKEPEEILKSWSIEATPRLVSAVAEAQREAWNEALDLAAENADLRELCADDGHWYTDKESILKLKK